MSPEDKGPARNGSTRSQQNEKDRARGQDKEHEKRSASKTAGNSKATGNKNSESKQPPASRLAAGKSARTTDHELIRSWVEDRGGSPAAVKAAEKGENLGLIRINFPGYSGEDRLEEISWEEFFKKFDENDLEFLYQDETRDGETSRFWMLVSREQENKRRR